MISVADLAAGAADFDLLDEDGRPRRPLLVVDLDRPATQAEVREAGRRARDGERLLVGRGARAGHALSEALDLTVVRAGDGQRDAVVVDDPQAEAEVLRERVGVQPQAALTLRQLLRMDLPVRQALEAESLAYSTLLGGSGFRTWRESRAARVVPLAEEPVLVDREGGVLRITLNHPARRNAHSAQLRDALTAAVELAVRDLTIREVLLDANGPGFSSGGDLDEFGTATDLATAHLIRVSAGAARRLHTVRDRLTARLHGHCIGAGIELPAFAGRVLAAPGTRVRLPELDMGLIPGAGGTVSIPRRIGRHRTLYLALSGRELDAGTALEWGLVDEVTPRTPAPDPAPASATP
ncbi:enoyl-CoA hydratase/isomerase family protein [Streptomyces sp. 4F14]|uniref:enoyl-CoA hydratase/isomerase family protein n=1 Tax=Streptomyces sp. 4F14 TaxID=3394380 RepID=UPI003A88F00F